MMTLEPAALLDAVGEDGGVVATLEDQVDPPAGQPHQLVGEVGETGG